MVRGRGGALLVDAADGLAYPACALAVAEAVQRDADNLPKGEKLPGAVDKLRSPATMLKD